METKIGNGFEFGPGSTGYERVRHARKSYSCEGAMVDADSLPREELSPGTGSLVLEGAGKTCLKQIAVSDLYVALDLAGEHAQDFGGEYRYTFRTCLNCALEFDVVRRSAD